LDRITPLSRLRHLSSISPPLPSAGSRAGKRRKPHAELNPGLVAEAKRLRRCSPKGTRRSLRDVAAELARLGYLNVNGKAFAAMSIRSMLGE
jgi:hypothetical protein